MVRSLFPGKFGAMLTLGPFTVAPDGTLSPRPATRPPALRFAWRGRPCEARLENGRLRLSALAGRVPSTAEPGADRAWTFGEVSRLPRDMPGALALRLTPDHRLTLEAEAPARGSAPAIVGEMVRFALALDPYLDRLDSVGAGKVNT